MKYRNKQQGLVKLIVVLVIALIVLGYFGFDVRTIIESPQVQENLDYAWLMTKGFFLSAWGVILELKKALT